MSDWFAEFDRGVSMWRGLTAGVQYVYHRETPPTPGRLLETMRWMRSIEDVVLRIVLEQRTCQRAELN